MGAFVNEIGTGTVINDDRIAACKRRSNWTARPGTKRLSRSITDTGHP
jgi:hypothetical protein